MEQKRYQKNYWNKFFLFLIAVGVAVLIFFYWIQKNSEKTIMLPNLDGTTAPALISVNIVWHDSAYCAVLENDELFYTLKKENKKNNSQTNLLYKSFINLSYKDTLTVDSLSFIRFKKYIVTPQHRIDSIHQSEGITGLFSAYFDDVWFVPSCEEGLLTLPEQIYTVHILQRYGYSVNIDCESGCLYIKEP